MLDFGPWNFKVQMACCLLMTGLIWLVQLVHYPSFHLVNPQRFQEFHDQHSSRISFIVAPLMGLELVTAILLVYERSDSYIWWLNLLGMVLIWACTAFLSVPLHNQLTNGYDYDKVNALVLTNWPRTLLWTARSIWLWAFAAP
ncbi:MAG: hypothetical protein RL011_2096 [Pseudomonadota bacterium]|jgi:hypothetical protein